jgi:hypothetical protein
MLAATKNIKREGREWSNRGRMEGVRKPIHLYILI